MSHSEWVYVCGYTGIPECMCASVRLVDLCPIFPLWAYGFWETNFKQQLFVALKDSISLGCVQFGVCSRRQNWACIRTGYQFSFLIICSAAYLEEIRELGRESFSPSTPACQRFPQQPKMRIKLSDLLSYIYVFLTETFFQMGFCNFYILKKLSSYPSCTKKGHPTKAAVSILYYLKGKRKTK